MKYLIRIPLGLLAIAVACAVAVIAVFIGGYYYVTPSVPQAAELRDLNPERPLQVLARDRRLIDEFGKRRSTPVDYVDIPPLVVEAILATEDEYFFEHPGIDYRGVLRGFFNELRSSGATVGGSTITQQIPRTLERSAGDSGRVDTHRGPNHRDCRRI
jgi:penicillin-binding protein 1A